MKQQYDSAQALKDYVNVTPFEAVSYHASVEVCCPSCDYSASRDINHKDTSKEGTLEGLNEVLDIDLPISDNGITAEVSELKIHVDVKFKLKASTRCPMCLLRGLS